MLAVAAARRAPRAAATALARRAALPAVALAIALVVPAITIVSNQLSRAVERRADAFALELTREPQTQIDFQRRIAVKNVADPDPPAWVDASCSGPTRRRSSGSVRRGVERAGARRRGGERARSG